MDSFVKWRIADVRRFYTLGRRQHPAGQQPAWRGDSEASFATSSASARFSRSSRGERAEIMDELRVAAKDQADELGLEIVDVRIKRVDSARRRQSVRLQTGCGQSARRSPSGFRSERRGAGA